MKAIDTNILIRFITKDDENQANLIYQLFKQTEEKNDQLFVPLLVVLEVIWVLQSCYGVSNADILSTFSDLLLMPILLFESEEVIRNFIDSAYNTKFDLSDVLIAHSAHSSDCQSVLTFDKTASKFKYFELLK
jgi:predicted nucleic-acid-binding protein